MRHRTIGMFAAVAIALALTPAAANAATATSTQTPSIAMLCVNQENPGQCSSSGQSSGPEGQEEWSGFFLLTAANFPGGTKFIVQIARPNGALLPKRDYTPGSHFGRMDGVWGVTGRFDAEGNPILPAFTLSGSNGENVTTKKPGTYVAYLAIEVPGGAEFYHTNFTFAP